MMNGDDVVGAGPIRHFDSLFRGAMIPNTGPVGAYGHERDRERPARAKLGEERCVSGVTSEENGFALAAQNVAVVAALDFAGPAFAPVFDLYGLNFERAGAI